MSGLVLVAAPTYAGKGYAFDRWLMAYNKLDYVEKAEFLVDNTRPDFSGRDAWLTRLEDSGVNFIHIDPLGDWDTTFRESWELILRKAIELNATWVYSVEADNIVPPSSLTSMVDIAEFAGLSMITMPYRQHGAAAYTVGGEPDDLWYNELGCLLMRREILERAMDIYEDHWAVATAISNAVAQRQPPGGYCMLSPEYFTVDHLDGFLSGFDNLGKTRNGLLYRPKKIVIKMESLGPAKATVIRPGDSNE